MRAAGFRLIRYADDFLILADRRWKAEAADRLVRCILADIGLEVAEDKSGIRKVRDGFDFLGFTFQGRFLRPRPRALAGFKDQVRSRTRRKAPISLRVMVARLNPTLRGWGNYFAMGDVLVLFAELDSWIRMRLRSAARKRFRSRPGADNHRWPNHLFEELGLVNLERLARQQRVSRMRTRKSGSNGGLLAERPGAYPLPAAGQSWPMALWVWGTTRTSG